MKLKTQLYLYFGTAFLVILIISSSIFYIFFLNNLNESNIAYLRTAAAVCMDNTDFQKIPVLNNPAKKAELQQTEYYKNTLAHLSNIQKIYHLAYVYTIVKNGDGYRFIFDTDNIDETDPEKITFLTDYKEPPADMLKTFSTGQQVLTDQPYTDEFGTFISLFTPLKNPDGTVYAIFGLDYDISYLKQKKIYVSIIFASTLCLTALFTILIINFVGRKIIEPMHTLSLKFKEIAEGNGDLTKELPEQKVVEISDMSRGFNEFQSKLREIILNIKDTSLNMASAMEQAASTTFSISENIQKQSSIESVIIESIKKNNVMMDEVSFDTDVQCNISEILGTMIKDLSNSIKGLSVEAKTAADMSNNVTDKITEGEKSLQALNTIMLNVERSSKEMNNIVALINDISDQINLLSLNASIESARAGDAGRGFAVVAEEISKLADKTAVNIKDINNLIRVNDSYINDGMISLKDTVASITSIILDINNITSVINKMSDFMDQQLVYEDQTQKQSVTMKTLTEQIKGSIDNHRSSTLSIEQTIEEIGRMGQDNAAAIEELAASTEEITGMSHDLDRMVNLFHT